MEKRMSGLINRLRELDESMTAGPWNEDAVYSAIRHVQRNTDIFEQCIDYAQDGEHKGMPGRSDGEPLARLRNLLPDIIAELEAITSTAQAE
jgi:hypothetical protein